MSNFFKETQKKRKEARDWASKFRESYERALRNIERHHERRLLTSQIILLAFIGGFFINVLASSIYDLFCDLHSFRQLPSLIEFLRMETLPLGGCLISSVILVAIYLFLRKEFFKYKPSNPILGFYITPEDTMPFLTEREFQFMQRYLEEGELRDFRTFGNSFFESLEKWFSHMFNPEVSKEPQRKSEEPDPLGIEEYPTMIREYDISSMSTTGVKVHLEVILAPNVIYGDRTAAYSFYVIFRFNILNPEHEDAGKFLDDYYHLHSRHIVEICSYCVASALHLPPRRKLPNNV